MTEKITFVAFLRFFRDKLWALVASFWMFMILAGITLWLLFWLLHVDKEFVHSLAEFSSIPTATLLGLAVGLRIVTVVYGPAAIWNKLRGQVKRARSFKIIGYSLAVILLVHCMFIASKMMGDQLSQSDAITQIEATTTTGNAAQIAALDAMAEKVRADRDANVAEYRQAIENITSDGLDNDEAADTYRQSIVDEQAAARTRLAEIDAKKLTLLDASMQASTEARVAEALQRPYHDGFIVMARFVTAEWNPDVLPSKTVTYVCGILFWLIWFGFIEMVVMAFSTMAFAMLMLARDIAEAKDAVAIQEPVALVQATDAIAPPPLPEPELEPEPEEYDPVIARSRAGGDASALERLRRNEDTRIPVRDLSEGNIERAAQ